MPPWALVMLLFFIRIFAGLSMRIRYEDLSWLVSNLTAAKKEQQCDILEEHRANLEDEEAMYEFVIDTFYAAEDGKIDDVLILRCLSERLNKNLGIKDRYDETLLFVAVRKNLTKSVEYLIDSGIPLDVEKYQTLHSSNVSNGEMPRLCDTFIGKWSQCQRDVSHILHQKERNGGSLWGWTEIGAFCCISEWPRLFAHFKSAQCWFQRTRHPGIESCPYCRHLCFAEHVAGTWKAPCQSRTRFLTDSGRTVNDTFVASIYEPFVLLGKKFLFIVRRSPGIGGWVVSFNFKCAVLRFQHPGQWWAHARAFGLQLLAWAWAQRHKIFRNLHAWVE